jgi:hypothetical protein
MQSIQNASYQMTVASFLLCIKPSQAKPSQAKPSKQNHTFGNFSATILESQKSQKMHSMMSERPAASTRFLATSSRDSDTSTTMILEKLSRMVCTVRNSRLRAVPPPISNHNILSPLAGLHFVQTEKCHEVCTRPSQPRSKPCPKKSKKCTYSSQITWIVHLD